MSKRKRANAKGKEEANKTQVGIADLPVELIDYLYSFLPPKYIGRIARLCRITRDVARSHWPHRTIVFSPSKACYEMNELLEWSVSARLLRRVHSLAMAVEHTYFKEVFLNLFPHAYVGIGESTVTLELALRNQHMKALLGALRVVMLTLAEKGTRTIACTAVPLRQIKGDVFPETVSFFVIRGCNATRFDATAGMHIAHPAGARMSATVRKMGGNIPCLHKQPRTKKCDCTKFATNKLREEVGRRLNVILHNMAGRVVGDNGFGALGM